MYHRALKFEGFKAPDSTVVIRVIVFDIDPETEAKSVSDIMEFDFHPNTLNKLSDWVASKAEPYKMNIKFDDDINFGRTKALKGKIKKAIYHMALEAG